MNRAARAIIHIPHGVLIAVASLVNAPLAWVFVVVFLAYEYLEEWRIADHSYRDLLGVLIGLAVVMIIYLMRRRNGKAA